MLRKHRARFFMNNLYTALTLCLINQKRFVITTNDVNLFIPNFQSLILQQQCNIEASEICIINLDDFVGKSMDNLVLKMSLYYDGVYTFKQIVIWKNLQNLSSLQQKHLYELMLQIDNFDTNGAKGNTTAHINKFDIVKPENFIIIPVLDISFFSKKIYQYLKERFSFLMVYNYTSLEDMMKEMQLIETFPMSKFPLSQPHHFENFQQFISWLRIQKLKVYVSPDIKRYIYSLVIFTRLHRLCSLAPKQTRLSTRSLDEIRELCIALTLWNNFHRGNQLFVTPDTVKVAMRRVGYWLVDWEYNTMFRYKANDEQTELQKRLQISILVGDWYGGDYDCIADYIKSYQAKLSNVSPIGYTNKIIDDVLRQVRPPM